MKSKCMVLNNKFNDLKIILKAIDPLKVSMAFLMLLKFILIGFCYVKETKVDLI